MSRLRWGPRLHVTFLYRGKVVYSRVYSERYAIRKMGDWYGKGPEYRCYNHPVWMCRTLGLRHCDFDSPPPIKPGGGPGGDVNNGCTAPQCR
jgi:hypothetical protein